MAEQGKDGIAWTEIVDRGGRRVRLYARKTHGPSKRLRQRLAAVGLFWCRRCSVWTTDVRKGLCREHRNELYREMYANGGAAAIKARVHARHRAVDPVPPVAQQILTERFAGRCAYCPEPATTWDYVAAVSRGGRTINGNIVPACASCNSRKRTRPVDEFAADMPHVDWHNLIDVIAAREACLG